MINFLYIREHSPEYHEDKPQWTYRYCRYVKDSPSVRKLINNSYWAYMYCRDIKDRPEIRKYITDSSWAYYYCTEIKDRSEVRMYITENYYLGRYREWKQTQ